MPVWERERERERERESRWEGGGKRTGGGGGGGILSVRLWSLFYFKFEILGDSLYLHCDLPLKNRTPHRITSNVWCVCGGGWRGGMCWHVLSFKSSSCPEAARWVGEGGGGGCYGIAGSFYLFHVCPCAYRHVFLCFMWKCKTVSAKTLTVSLSELNNISHFFSKFLCIFNCTQSCCVVWETKADCPRYLNCYVFPVMFRQREQRPEYLSLSAVYSSLQYHRLRCTSVRNDLRSLFHLSVSFL